MYLFVECSPVHMSILTKKFFIEVETFFLGYASNKWGVKPLSPKKVGKWLNIFVEKYRAI